ncbi:MAG TPA: glucose-6-phosphate isomerase [Oscillospiraceae bacterium]|nr:glucose-6-phosphate isomerase [Oscillospiraceae bacterium]
MVSLEFSGLKNFIDETEFRVVAPETERALALLKSGQGAGAEFTGFIALPENYDKKEFLRIKEAAQIIREQSDVLIVIGIGGSYLGASAVIELLTSPFYNLLRRNGTEIYFAGNSLSSDSLNEIVSLCEGKDVSVNVISKSGTTTEPALAFRVFRRLLTEKYGAEGAKKRIFCTTDRAKGTLRALADAEGWETFVVPDDIGGRFSVLTPVGLLPIAVAGIDIDALMFGAAEAKRVCCGPEFGENPALRYAAARRILGRMGKSVELLVSYEPAFRQMAEWWKQLFGESEGKDGKGIFPASAIFSTDLHSLGQFIQEGSRTMFETVVRFEKPRQDFIIEKDAADPDGLNFLAGQGLFAINEKARQGTLLAHTEGGVPNIGISVPDRSAFELGWLIYFFEIAVSVSGYLLGVNPFDQPGVEAYKKNMFALLGKPGYEDLRASLEQKLR